MTSWDFLRTRIEEVVRDEHQSLYTFLPVIIEDIDRSTWRCEVSRKDDKEILADKVPLASAYAGDGYGEIHPVSVGDEAFLHCSTIPLEDFDEKGHQETPKQRTHSMRDGVLYLRTWFEDQDVPDVQPGEYLYYHESGTTERITPDGTWVTEHPAGGSIQLDDTGVGFEVPDEDTNQEQDKTTELRANTDGTITANGVATVGDSDAMRWDPAAYGNNPDDSVANLETDEEIAPIVDPTDSGETQYFNPPQMGVTGPVDMGLFELRRHVPERREADPDVTVTDPSNEAFVEAPQWMRDLGRLPAGYQWLNITEDTMKRIAMDGSIKPME